MQASQVKEYFPEIQRSIDNAAELCQITRDVPDDVRESLGELGRESDHVRQVVDQANSEEHIRQSLLRLEKMGGRALEACEQAGSTVNRDVRSAVYEAHEAISSLKRRLLH